MKLYLEQNNNLVHKKNYLKKCTKQNNLNYHELQKVCRLPLPLLNTSWMHLNTILTFYHNLKLNFPDQKS